VVQRKTDVLVVGAGLSGLALATRVAERGMSVHVLEAAPAAGGNLRTRRLNRRDGDWLLDLGPNSFGDAAAPLMDLVRLAGLEDRVVRSTVGGRRFVWRAGWLREVPSHPLKFLTAGLLPPWGLLRLAKEPWVAPRPADAPEESLGAFCDRRLGRSARDKLLTPVVGGIYAGDPMRLGAESAFPAMVALEREHGSLLRAAMRGKGPPSRGTLSSFKDGIGELPEALARRLGESLTTSAAARTLARDGDRWRVEAGDGRTFLADTLVVTTPSAEAAGLVEPFDEALAGDLRAIEYAPMTVVHAGFKTSAVRELPPGFGFLVPRREGLRILGAIFSSRLFPGRAPAGFELITVFAGGSLDPDAMSLGDVSVHAFVEADLRRALGLSRPLALCEITRWRRAIPQYAVGHKDRVARIDELARRHKGLRLLGNWRGGIAMPDCVRNAESLAAELADGRPTG
jgi:oxygen-dependent protoporphyrinogen oxidase